MEKIINKRNVMLFTLIALIFIGPIWFYFHKDNDTMMVIDNTAEDQINAKEKEEEADSIEPNQSSQIMVHIAGQVKSPGVAILTEGDRLIDALNQLGGPLEDADLERVNLSQRLQDEEKVYIPKIGEEWEPSQESAGVTQFENPTDDKVNINTADQSQLKTLPGIGDALSARIIEYRDSHGGFKSIDEIKEVDRIGEKVFNQLKDKIKI